MNVFVKWRIFCNNLEPFEHDRKTFLNKSNKTKIVSIKFTETRLTFCCYNTISWSIINRPASRIVHDWALKRATSWIPPRNCNPANNQFGWLKFDSSWLQLHSGWFVSSQGDFREDLKDSKTINRLKNLSIRLKTILIQFLI